MQADAEQPLVTVITPCFNRVRFIADAIESVLSQDYPRIDHVVMDGASTDGTVDVLRRYDGQIRWYSEPDEGQSHCLNRLLRLVEGEIVGWMNSDDFYYPGAVRRAVEILEADPTLDAVYGCCALVDVEGNRIGMHAAKPFSVKRLIWYDSGYVPPQAFFFRRRVIERVGDFDETLKYALDYDWLVRLGKTSRVLHVPELFGAFRRHEDATQGRILRREYRRETVRVSRRHGGNLVTPIKWNLIEGIPGSLTILRAISPVKKMLVRVGLLPEWL
jgi:glycosyltransferase involved in cell wall biosynthesis